MASAIEKERTALEGGGYMRDCVEAAYWVGQDPVNMGDCEVAGSEADGIGICISHRRK